MPRQLVSILCTLCVSLISCGQKLQVLTANVDSLPTTSNPVLTPYLTQFKASIAGKSVESSVSYANLYMNWGANMAPSTIAQCTLSFNGDPSSSTIARKDIYVNQSYWSQANIVKYEFMYHELSHCLLYRGHVTDIAGFSYHSGTTTAPTSIMYPSPVTMVVNQTFFADNLAYYLNELFLGSNYGDMFDVNGNVKSVSPYKSDFNKDQLLQVVFESKSDGKCSTKQLISKVSHAALSLISK